MRALAACRTAAKVRVHIESDAKTHRTPKHYVRNPKRTLFRFVPQSRDFWSAHASSRRFGVTERRRLCFWTFEEAVECAVLSAVFCSVNENPRKIADTTAQRTLLWFQRNEAAAALAPDADQNLFVRLQFLADGHQILRVLDRLLVYFLDHVAFAQASFCGGRLGINFRNHSSFDVF